MQQILDFYNSIGFFNDDGTLLDSVQEVLQEKNINTYNNFLVEYLSNLELNVLLESEEETDSDLDWGSLDQEVKTRVYAKALHALLEPEENVELTESATSNYKEILSQSPFNDLIDVDSTMIESFVKQGFFTEDNKFTEVISQLLEEDDKNLTLEFLVEATSELDEDISRINKLALKAEKQSSKKENFELTEAHQESFTIMLEQIQEAEKIVYKENATELINNIINQKGNDALTTFDSMLKTKTMDLISQKQTEVSETIFNRVEDETEETVETEEVDETEETIEPVEEGGGSAAYRKRWAKKKKGVK